MREISRLSLEIWGGMDLNCSLGHHATHRDLLDDALPALLHV